MYIRAQYANELLLEHSNGGVILADNDFVSLLGLGLVVEGYVKEFALPSHSYTHQLNVIML